jgi:cysteinyl-tRNA synthetase
MKDADGTDDAEKIVKKARKRFESAMDDNLNTGKALKVLEEFTDDVSRINPERESSGKILETFRRFESMLGIGII